MTYQEQAESLQTVLSGGGDWAAASPCAGWTAADVVDHLIDTQRSFLAGQDVDLGPRPDGDPPTSWAAHVTAVGEKVDETTRQREYDGYFGRTTVGATLTDFYGFDMVAHRWDIARALGRDTTFTDPEMDAMEASITVFGENLYAEGICARPVPVPDGATRQERLLATLGRDPRG